MDRVRPPIIPSLAPETSDRFLDRLLNPARFFKHPHDVLKDDMLDVQEKQAILSSWASDVCTIESMPGVCKAISTASPVTFDTIMDAWSELERQQDAEATELRTAALSDD